jgi:triacylglycerol lipase
MSGQEWIWSVSAAVLLLLALLALWRSARRRRSRLPALLPAPAPARVFVVRKRQSTRHPIVLAHGWGCIDRVLPMQLGYSSFRDIPAALRASGHEVHVARVAPAASIERRASQLAQQIAALDGRVNIIAHSMGGLDARLAIAKHGIAERVASLTTIATPHHGTPLADVTLALGEFRRARDFVRRFGLDMDGVYDLSTARMRAFNAQVPDADGVLYANVLGEVERAAVHVMLSGPHRFLLRAAGPNDGVVPAHSQQWGETLEVVAADHWAQVGWFGSFDARAFYTRLAGLLVQRDL